jgi:hypothetical protein
MTNEEIIELIRLHAKNLDDLNKISGAIESFLEEIQETE